MNQTNRQIADKIPAELLRRWDYDEGGDCFLTKMSDERGDDWIVETGFGQNAERLQLLSEGAIVDTFERSPEGMRDAFERARCAGAQSH